MKLVVKAVTKGIISDKMAGINIPHSITYLALNLVARYPPGI
jgi:arginine/lysine/ornithine decarboxylase